MLPFSTHDIFYSEHNKQWVRTGTDTDGNCFFHAYAYCVEANDYRNLSPDQRKARVMQIKRFISHHIQQEDCLHLIYPDAFESIVLSIERMIHPYQPLNLEKQPLLSIQGYLSLLYHTYPLLSSEKVFQEKLERIVKHYHSTIKSYLARDGTWVFDSLLPLIMKYLNINIRMISHKTNKVITHSPSYPASHTIYLYHSGDHFESVGLYENQLMKRVFEYESFP